MASIKSSVLKPFAKYISRQIQKDSEKAVIHQKKVMTSLVKGARKTKFGQDHHFDKIRSYQDFKKAVPIRDYEGLSGYIDKILNKEKHVLWKGKPKYFAKTSGTTSGVKYIPLTKNSMPNHINTARNAMFNYVHKSGNSAIFDGKMIFLSGSPTLEFTSGVPTGRLSGIVNHEVPAWLRSNQLPSYETNCIEEWETKLDRIIDETMHQDMRLISGIPPWVQMYYERLLERTGKSTVAEVFPNFSLFIYGGVNFSPYKTKLESLIGKPIDSVELYPASEGFIAFQDQLNSSDLLLNTNSGIFFEFIPLDEFFSDNPTRIMLEDVELDKDYAIILNNNAGLWAYNIGDTVRFTSKNPYRLVVSGRVKHFISAFGEHVIAKEVEQAMASVLPKYGIKISEFTVAPQVNPAEGLPYHEWFIAFEESPSNLADLELEIDLEMQKQNIYYKDLIDGNMLRTLKITPLRADIFRDYMKTQGKLGGQNKVPRLSDNRKIADVLEQLSKS